LFLPFNLSPDLISLHSLMSQLPGSPVRSTGVLAI
jgi:hypothetical protein